MRYADTVARQVVSLLGGSAEPDPMQHGLTTDEERAASRAPQVGLECELWESCNAHRLLQSLWPTAVGGGGSRPCAIHTRNGGAAAMSLYGRWMFGCSQSTTSPTLTPHRLTRFPRVSRVPTLPPPSASGPACWASCTRCTTTASCLAAPPSSAAWRSSTWRSTASASQPVSACRSRHNALQTAQSTVRFCSAASQRGRNGASPCEQMPVAHVQPDGGEP